MAKRSKQVKYGEPGYRHPYMDYEGTPMWSWVWKALRDLVDNKDLVEKEDPPLHSRIYLQGHREGAKAGTRKTVSKIKVAHYLPVRPPIDTDVVLM